MKKKFSTSWKSSKQPRKQRKYKANAPLHLKRKFISSNLSKDLRKKYGKRALPLRKGDLVKLMRGKFKGKKGKIIKVMVKTQKIWVEGIQVKKQDGAKVNISLRPSNLQIIELNLEDKKRNNSLKKIVKEERTKEKKELPEKKLEKQEKSEENKKNQNKKNQMESKK
ncbi:50S ribosomal protein L24 [Patescibacteria group bacterium]|nr:50S ribosomal protein L24 [Patescibacteria group bacterium]